MLDENIFKKLFIFIILGVLVILSLVLLWPIASSVVLGLLLAYIFYPAYKKVMSFVKEKNTSAIIILLGVFLLIFVPFWFLLPVFIKQVFEVYSYFQQINVFSFFQSVFPNLADASFSKGFSTSFNNFIIGLFGNLVSGASDIFLDLPNLLLKAVIVLFVFFFGMRDAERFSDYVLSLSPFSKSMEKELRDKFSGITNSVVYGYFVVGILQGITTGIGLLIFGVPQVLLLTIISVFMAIIPVLGAWAVWLPSAIYLIASGETWKGVGLIAYSLIIVSWIDNVIRAYIVSKRVNISSVLVLIGIIGGLMVFGFLGLVIGPLILAYLLLILDAYREKKFKDMFS